MSRGTFTFEGKRHDVTAKDGSKLAAKIALKKRDLEEGRITINGNTKVSVWIEEYLSTYKKNTMKAISYSDLKSRINHNITSQIGQMTIKDIKPIHCQKILNNLEGMSADHIKKVNNAMFDIFEKALDNKMILSNPAAKLKKPKGYKKSRRAITKTEREYILKVAEYNRAGLWVLIMLYCGLRPNETSLIQGKHIDRNKKVLHIEGTKTINANRFVPIPDILLSKLPKMDPFEYLFINQRDGQISDDNRRLMWLSFRRDLNIAMGCKVFRNEVMPVNQTAVKNGAKPIYKVAEDLVPYCMRHTYCTDLQAAGVPINVAKELMGHSDISLTAKIYTHRSDEAFNSAVKLINEFQNKKQESV
jgi:integrase